jgi:predicted PurR-regulated permease PerM
MADGLSTDDNAHVGATSGQSRLGTLLAAAIVIAGLHFGQEVFVPVALAVLLSFVLAPVVRALQAWGLGRVLPVVAVVACTFLALVSLGAIVASQFAQLAGNLPQYQSTMRKKIADLRSTAGSSGPLERAADVLQDLGNELRIAPSSRSIHVGERPSEQRPVIVEVREPDLSPFQMLSRFVVPLMHPLATTGIVIVFMFFILLQREDLRNRFIRLVGAYDLQRTTAAMDDAARRLSRFFLRQVLVNSCFGVTVGLGLWLIGVPSPALWGILAALARFIPYVGAFLAAGFPMLLAAAVDPGWTMLFATMALFIGLDLLVGQVIEPVLYGHSTGLSPIAVVISATFWTWLWGPIGLLLATPLTVLLVVLGRHVESLEFLDIMLGDRPPLTGPETFYQRVLAGDPAEAEEQAEQFLKKGTLAAYYDEIAAKGLLLAQADAARGVLDASRIRRIEETVLGLIEDLAEFDDTPPSRGDAERARTEEAEDSNTILNEHRVRQDAIGIELPVLARESMAEAWRSPNPVLCIAGRSGLDRAGAGMLAQLLGKHGIGARVEGADVLATTRIFSLDVEGVVMVVLSYFDVSSPVHVRFAIRRLRRKLPNAVIMVGCWGMDGDRDAESLASEAKADLAATTLTQALEMCLAAAVGAPVVASAPVDNPPITLIPAPKSDAA